MKQTIVTITGEGDAMEMEVKTTDYETGKSLVFSILVTTGNKNKLPKKLHDTTKSVIDEIITICKELTEMVPFDSIVVTNVPIGKPSK